MNEKQPQPNPGEQPDHEARYERQPTRSPRVWIGSLADYNNGTLHGDWVDAAVDDGGLIAAAQRIVESSEEPGAEEYAIFDYDDFGDFKVDQYEQLSLVAKVARGIQEHGDAFAAWAQLHDADHDMLDAFDDDYLGEYDSPEDWAREIANASNIEQRIEETFGSDLASYIRFDAARFAQDAWLGGDIYVMHKDDGGCWIFAVQ